MKKDIYRIDFSDGNSVEGVLEDLPPCPSNESWDTQDRFIVLRDLKHYRLEMYSVRTADRVVFVEEALVKIHPNEVEIIRPSHTELLDALNMLNKAEST